ncbi:Rne/Rng family ribonuclease [Aquabacter cavernae]|uniref:Rne/Rng family ribonuclease n=1 Tax=Aquabacter cavernae TaxID=2496029 RepID=UPI000F8F77A0|nr:ribonuclease E/G [Aquabacter cavernae]
MANKMLIDATHPEETRVVVVRGSRVEEFDYEAASRKQLRGNIYLAKVTRVEPSLQAAFVEYGGNRHGFLAFSEIHPDYYQIPVADRLALLEEEERAARQADEEDERRERRRSRPRRARRDETVSGTADEDEDTDASGNVEEVDDDDVVETIEDGQISGGHDEDDDEDDHGENRHAQDHHAEAPEAETPHIAEEMFGAPVEADEPVADELPAPLQQAAEPEAEIVQDAAQFEQAPQAEQDPAPVFAAEDVSADADAAAPEYADAQPSAEADEDADDEDEDGEDEGVEQMGSADALEEVPVRAPQRRARTYKIQEVIRRRQVMLVQVVKEERGNKGAALTTYLSLAGRYSVLMPNTARGGGISRKITNAVDRKRLKEVVQDLEVPDGMGIILRTAGANRTKVEIKRDFEYLLRLWETVRELTLRSAAPNLVYEEGSLIKRAIRDLYNKDIDDIHVAGEEGFREARDFMRMLMPSHTKNVISYGDTQPIFAKYGVEAQLDAMFSPVVQLKSGGYIVINPTEALVSIDVNSGRATREHHIEDTALKTNMEASEEIARQLRLRDLAGLIVIDFIDMEEKRNNRSVERKLKDCLKNDRARIQVGRISHFGLMEMSRQRIRTGVLESSIEVCPTCGGTGHVRSASSVALQLLRALEEQLVRSTTHNLVARTRSEVALYVLNHKRAHLRELEERFSVTLVVSADDRVTGHQPFIIEKGDPAAPAPAAPRPTRVVQPDSILPDEEFEEEEEETAEESAEAEETEERAERGEDGNGRRKRRRRRRRNGERDGEREGEPREPRAEGEAEGDEDAAGEGETEGEEGEDDERADARNADGERRRRRRGRRGGRRNRREGEEGEGTDGAEAAEGEDEDNAGTDAPQAEGHPAEAASDDAPAPAEIALPEPVEAPALAPVSIPAEAPAPEAAPVEEAPAPAAEKSTRRRSTVREKAPSVSVASPAAVSGEETASVPVSDADMPVSAVEPEAAVVDQAPPATESAPEPAVDPSLPPEKARTGWWQRKLFGG